MLKITLRGILAHKFRLVSTFISVALAVGFMSGTLSLTDTISKTFNDLFADINQGTDSFVRAKSQFDAGFNGGDQRGRVDESLVETIRGVDGVAAAEGGVQGYARIIDSDGDPIGDPNFGAPTFGGNWQTVDAINPWTLVEGSRPPTSDDEVVIDKKSVDDGHLKVGDKVTIDTKQSITFNLVGIARFGTADSPGGASFALFTLPVAQELVAEPGKLDAIVAVADDGVSQTEVTDNIRKVLPKGVEALTGDQITKENQSDIKEGFSFFTLFMLIFAGIAVVVGAFVIYNTFTIIVAQRLREMALLRAIGAGRRQVLSAVLLEALVIGVLASLVGLFLGFITATVLKALLALLGFELPATSIVFTTRTAIISMIIGVGVTVTSALVPAIRASRVPPIAAMRDVATERPFRAGPRAVLGVAVTLIGALLLYRGLNDGPAILLAVGVIGVFGGIIVLGATFAKPASRVLGAPVARTRGITGQLARENAMRNPRRTGSTASALTIGMAIMAFFFVFNASLTASFNKIIDTSFFGDLVIDSGSFGFGGLPPEMTDRINDLPEVATAAAIRGAPIQVDGGSDFVTGVDPKRAFDLFDIGITQGKPSDLGVDAIAVHVDKAKDKGWKIGSEVPAKFASTGAKTLRVAMLYDDKALAGNYVLGFPAYDANYADKLDAQVYVKLAPGFDNAKGRAAVKAVTDDYAVAKLQDLSEFKKARAAQFGPILGLIAVLLLMSIVIASLGIANTIALSVLERTKEIGLLRAVGALRKQVRSLIRWESVIIAVLGTIVGMLVGIGFSYAVVAALKAQGFTVFRVPVPSLVILLLLAMVLGVVAALRPARRAAKLDVLDAIASE